jgi:hypothetical protein
MVGASQEPGTGKRLAAKSPELEFAIVLSRIIGSVNDDPAQLRSVVYELARIKLQRELSQRDPFTDVSETRHLTLALESAIEHVETVYSNHENLQAPQPLHYLTSSSKLTSFQRMAQSREPALVINQSPAAVTNTNNLSNCSSRAASPSGWAESLWRWSGAAPLLRGAIVVILAFALCVVLDRQFAIFGRQAPQPFLSPVVQKIKRTEPKPLVQTSGQAPTITLPSQSLGFPLPNVYGVYAVSGGQLHELEPLVGRVPDQRVFMSTPVKTPSRTVLPDGRIVFIIYRRDVATSAPDRVAVRVIAKIFRALSFNAAGQPSTKNVDDLWTIRNVSYDFRVAPLGEGSDMLLIRPEHDDFAFPGGRYGLVIKGQAFDFTVAGPVTEAAQCLEGIKAENGTFYSECRHRNEARL